jgi:hypothetical protein
MPVASKNKLHPLYLRLLEPLEPIYAAAFTAAVPEYDDEHEGSQAIAYIVARRCPEVEAWTAQLRALHRKDKTYVTEDSISRLSATPITARALRRIGLIEREHIGEGNPVAEPGPENVACASIYLLVILVEDGGAGAVGLRHSNCVGTWKHRPSAAKSRRSSSRSSRTRPGWRQPTGESDGVN